MFKIENLKKRIENLPAEEISSLMNFNRNDVSFGNSGEVRETLNELILSKFENEEIDEIELIIIESGI